MTPPRLNPFRVDCVSALPWLGDDLETLVSRFLELRQAAIVGPHGVGKSTLLRSIGKTLADRGHAVLALSLPGSATAAQRRAIVGTPMKRDAVVLLDGYEQLTHWQRFHARRRFGRLLVTAHAPSRSLPTLLTIRPNPKVLHRVLVALLDPVPPELLSRAEKLLLSHRGDVRQCLFDLYDQAGNACSSSENHFDRSPTDP